MASRALLIGAQTYGLTGVAHDLVAIREVLAGFGFDDIRECEGICATREGILGAYGALIADTVAGDRVFVYYSGHGGCAREASGVATIDRQYIVPTDFDQTSEGDFRGITAVELSVLLGRLIERTDNAVVVLDCCHSAMMSRDFGDLVVRQIPPMSLAELDAHVERLTAGGLRTELAPARGHETAVRLVACAADQLAFESRHPVPGVAGGLLTAALVEALSEAAGTRVSWSRLIDRVRYQVRLHAPHQRPEAEGPTERVLFETDDAEDTGSLPVEVIDGRAVLRGASLLGVQVGDEFSITSERSGYDLDKPVATVQIDRCDRLTASGPLEILLPADARARRTSVTAPRLAVRVPTALDEAVRGVMFVRPAEPGENTPVRIETEADGRIVLHDAIGPLHEPAVLGEQGARRVAANLGRVARATTLLSIRDDDAWTFDAPIELQWGRVVSGRRERLECTGKTIRAGNSIYVSVRNTGRTDLYVSLLDIGLSYAVTLLTDFLPSGVLLKHDEEYVFGAGGGYGGRPGVLEGVELMWPDGLPAVAPRPETVLAFATTEPHDMTVLEQNGVRGGHAGKLALMLAHLSIGGTRDLRPTARTELYCVRAIEFTVEPVGQDAA